MVGVAVGAATGAFAGSPGLSAVARGAIIAVAVVLAPGLTRS